MASKNDFRRRRRRHRHLSEGGGHGAGNHDGKEVYVATVVAKQVLVVVASEASGKGDN